MKNVELNKHQFTYLTGVPWLSKKMHELIVSAERVSDDRFVLKISIGDAEEFRNAFTERLARVGFDLNYGVNAEGAMLESLIDEFYAG